MRIIDPAHIQPADCFIKDLLPGDVFESQGFHWLRTAGTEDSYIGVPVWIMAGWSLW